MSLEMSGWPDYDNAGESLRQETFDWGDRLEMANRRYDNLNGELGAAAVRLSIGIVDANESPDEFSMLNVYGGLFDDEASGSLLFVNYDAQTPPGRTEELVAAIEQQRDEAGVQAAIAVVGYDRRLFSQLRQDAWDIAVAHGLRTGTELPIVGVSNDFDMVSASSAYWARMTDNEYVGQAARLWSSKVKPETYGSPDLIINRLIGYLFAARALMTDITGRTLVYGASTATTLETYASSKGWIGSYNEQFQDGVMEPSQLALNILERARGFPVSGEDSEHAVLTHARSVADDGFVCVSARRETVEYATFLSGNPYPMGLITTQNDNAYRRLTSDELATLAQGVRTRTERIREDITEKERAFRKGLDKETSLRFAAALRKVRQELDLPEPDDVSP
jgi:hypothetical protein